MTSSTESPPHLQAVESPAAELYCPTCDQIFENTHKRCPIDGTALVRLANPKDPLLGRELDGRFTLKRRIGAGGMGAVYLAWQHSVGREVAVKVIHPKHNTDREAAKRFLREAKLASRLQHPNTVTVLDFNQTEDGFLYLVMELLVGRQLSDVLREEGPFSVERMVRVALQLCDALEAAHKLSIVHRDLKPGNIIVLDGTPGRDFVKVLDFGLARSLSTDESSKLTRTGEVVGTPHYLPPEAALGNPMDARGDIYSLGVIFYELLAGRLPFEAEGRRAMMIKHVYEDPLPLPLHIEDRVAAVIMKMLEKEPDRRHRDVHELRTELTELLSPSAQTSLPSRPREPSQRVATGSPTSGRQNDPQGDRSSSPSRPNDNKLRPRPFATPQQGFDAPTSVVPALGRPPASAPRRWWLLARGPVVGVIGGVASWVAATPKVVSKPIAAPPPIVEPAVSAPVAAPVVTPLAAPSVKLQLRSKPAASVTIDGKEHGRTPLDLDWPESNRPIDVTFSEPGRKPSSQKITPNRAQTIEATLQPAAQKPRPGKRPPTEKEGFLLPE